MSVSRTEKLKADLLRQWVRKWLSNTQVIHALIHISACFIVSKSAGESLQQNEIEYTVCYNWYDLILYHKPSTITYQIGDYLSINPSVYRCIRSLGMYLHVDLNCLHLQPSGDGSSMLLLNINIYLEATQRYNPENQHRHLHRRLWCLSTGLAYSNLFYSGEPLNCFDYIAWAPSEPRDRLADEDCVVLDSYKQWGVTKCSTRMPYLCELWPSGDQTADTATRLTKCTVLQNLGNLQCLCFCLF